eukprot:6183120-Pleurochrysis_carterae.AAC.3
MQLYTCTERRMQQTTSKKWPPTTTVGKRNGRRLSRSSIGGRAARRAPLNARMEYFEPAVLQKHRTEDNPEGYRRYMHDLLRMDAR